MDEATAVDQRLKELQRSISEQSKTTRMAQIQYKRQKRSYDAITVKEEEAAKKIADEQARINAEAKAARAAAAAERKAAAAAAKAEFEAKVAAKRTTGFM